MSLGLISYMVMQKSARKLSVKMLIITLSNQLSPPKERNVLPPQKVLPNVSSMLLVLVSLVEVAV